MSLADENALDIALFLADEQGMEVIHVSGSDRKTDYIQVKHPLCGGIITRKIYLVAASETSGSGNAFWHKCNT